MLWLSFIQNSFLSVAVDPSIFIKAFGDFSIGVKTSLFEAYVHLNADPFTVTPLDLQIAYDLDNNQVCYGVSYTQEVLNASVQVETKIYECRTGIMAS